MQVAMPKKRRRLDSFQEDQGPAVLRHIQVWSREALVAGLATPRVDERLVVLPPVFVVERPSTSRVRDQKERIELWTCEHAPSDLKQRRMEVERVRQFVPRIDATGDQVRQRTGFGSELYGEAQALEHAGDSQLAAAEVCRP